MQEKWLKDIKPDDMPTDNLRLIADACGVETAVNLIENLAGISVYIPGSALTHLKTNYIKKKYDGTRDCANRLALELGVSINYIYKILKTNSEEQANRKQLTLFGGDFDK
ncbi:MAG: Mor transcription activator family protein [Candidatus Gastranaerophilales bacterium]|nr:Mor transcription activator family protein [Candidatus Gastranaerophilales bacterium]